MLVVWGWSHRIESVFTLSQICAMIHDSLMVNLTLHDTLMINVSHIANVSLRQRMTH